MKKYNKAVKSLLSGLLLFSTAAMFSSTADAQTVQVRGIDHVGLNVPDMGEAIHFFSETFGFSPATEMRDVAVDEGFRTVFHMHSGAKVKSIVMMRAGNSANLELFQYDSPDSAKEQPYYDDLGSGHVAFYTEDIGHAVAALRANGVKVLTDPIVMNQGPTAGESWVYFLTPWGAKLELVSYPNGKAYEKQAGTPHLWTPPLAAPSPASGLTLAEVQVIADHYLALFNETDSEKRLAGLNRYFLQDAPFFDPQGELVGTVELNNFITKLQQPNQGWVFVRRGNVEVTGASARVPWQYGPTDDPTRVEGEDVFVLRDGKIASMTVFLRAGK